jgi:UDP-N-acetylmuramate dehydrogenase
MPTVALQKRLGDRLLRDEPMARYTAARIGGPADWLYIARKSTDELIEVVAEAWAQGIPVRVLGGGANVLVADRGVRGLMVINRVSEVKFGSWHDGRAVSATSGTGLAVLSQKCQTHGLAGLEWAVSIPGTVGGAIVNNAGAHGGDVSCCLGDAVVLEKDGPKLYSNEEMEYDYRYSMLKGRSDRQFLVLLATFIVFRDDPRAIKDRMSKFVDYRKRSQPPGASLGSIFKNPPGDYAGRLIEKAGLKGHRIGSVMVSPIHANFFVNDINSMGSATASDYYALVCHVRDVVYARSGIKLEPEIEFVGQWD